MMQPIPIRVKMAKAGVKVVIRSNDAENTRNLPFNAGFAAAYGMGKEEALKAVTINAAEVFGVANRLGSVRPVKMRRCLCPLEILLKPKHRSNMCLSMAIVYL